MSQLASLATKLSARYPWLSAPFIANAPMRVMAGPALAVAVSRAGGLGFIGPNIKTADTIADLKEAAGLIEKSRASSTSKLLSLPSDYPNLPVGAGFLLWKDDIDTAMSAVKEYKPCAVWLYAPQNGQQDLDLWTEKIRAASSQTQVWIQIGTVIEAKEIIQSPTRPDVVVVQGSEAGGHGRATDGMGLISLFPEVADVFGGHDIPLFATGGIADARGTAAALCLGASGVVMGTRFLAATEARIRKGYQDEVVRATDGAKSTTRTLLYNHLQGTYGWPEPFCPRTILNRTWDDHQAGVSFEELQRRFQEETKKGDAGWGPEGRLPTYAGSAVGLIGEVQDAGAILGKIRQDTIARLTGFTFVNE
ncbi:hypothetical protein ASPWEDRAFT_43331 [Aspergillus wentii DTO 134E9]|uniref:Uncharacterized protein n=1 Tax=Aspergillus wentii DTO 134E9 TaxID=1073089 RepID=A0A1L9REA5_ASPWE|nr:uncharacterized protein ASPWEDRAFT_43331 [Aspergillus wentii DTO 134E9]KAI9933505.1 hypothetical protein MW887_007978 [Aspergillus wentii]OJJ33251.1 hypothetical protein ASPWEDRAFT_43331 [Aspergillus wentii DTO 134E9]